MSIILPISLPFSFANDSVKYKIRLPFRETIDLEPVYIRCKIPIHETASGHSFKIPCKETAWMFNGLIIDENIVAKMNKSLTLLEGVRSRILADIELVSANQIKVKWFGDSVPNVTIFRKLDVDENYEMVGTYSWNQGEQIIKIDSNDYNVKLEGTNGSGSSAIYTLGETSSSDIVPNIGITLNEKIYEIPIEYVSNYRIDINY